MSTSLPLPSSPHWAPRLSVSQVTGRDGDATQRAVRAGQVEDSYTTGRSSHFQPWLTMVSHTDKEGKVTWAARLLYRTGRDKQTYTTVTPSGAVLISQCPLCLIYSVLTLTHRNDAIV